MKTTDIYSTTELNVSSTGQVTEICFNTFIVNRPTTSYIINSACGVLVNAILAIFGTFLNALVVTVFWKTRRLRKKVSYFMIMLLSCNDLCVTVIVHPLYMLNSITEITHNSKCVYKMIYQTLLIMLSGISYLTFVVMNIERYLSICRPFFHMSHVTKKKCFILSACLWLICIGTAISAIFGMDIRFFVTAITVVALGGVFFIYLSVYRVARKSRNSPLRRSTTKIFELQESTRPEKTVPLLHDLQLAKMYVIVVVSTVLLNLPNAVVLVVFNGRVRDVDGAAHAKIWTLALISMHSTFNSIIFFWANRQLRNEGRKLCKKLCDFSVRGRDTKWMFAIKKSRIKMVLMQLQSIPLNLAGSQHGGVRNWCGVFHLFSIVRPCFSVIMFYYTITFLYLYPGVDYINEDTSLWGPKLKFNSFSEQNLRKDHFCNC